MLLADDDRVIRVGLANLLNLQDEINVVAAVENGCEVLRVPAEQSVDVVLPDIDMPVCDGISTAKKIAEIYPGITVVMLTVFECEDSLAQFLSGERKFSRSVNCFP